MPQHGCFSMIELCVEVSLFFIPTHVRFTTLNPLGQDGFDRAMMRERYGAERQAGDCQFTLSQHDCYRGTHA